MQPRGLGKRVVPAYRLRRIERPAAAVARRCARLVDEVEHALRCRLLGHPHQRRKRLRHHDPDLARVQVNADLCHRGILQLLAVALFCQHPCHLCADPVTAEPKGVGTCRPVPGRLQALLQFISSRKISGDALERGLWLQRRQFFRDGAIAFTGAQPVDRSVKIARRRIETDGKQKQTRKNTKAHDFGRQIEPKSTGARHLGNLQCIPLRTNRKFNPLNLSRRCDVDWDKPQSSHLRQPLELASNPLVPN